MRRLWLPLLLAAGLLAWALFDHDEDWSRLEVQTAGPQIGSSMAWDSAREVFVLHGGRNHSWDPLEETWEWSPGASEWCCVVRASDPNPGPRNQHAMVWDAKRERMLLFGGDALGSAVEPEGVWAYDGKVKTWTRLETTGDPAVRSQHGMVYDPDGDELLVFGGRDERSQPVNETWSLNLATLQWSLLAPPEGRRQPAARDHVQMARDPLSVIIVIRGHSLGRGLPDETWHFDAKARNWTLIETEQQPGDASHGFFCAVAAAGGLVFFGFDFGSETWLYEPASRTWTELDVGGQRPSRPMDHGQFASDGNKLYLLGGFVSGASELTPLGGMWLYPADEEEG